MERLAAVRSEIDAINVEILESLEARGRLVREVMAIKERLGRPMYDPQRERVMMEELLYRAADVYPPASIERVFSAIFAVSRELKAENSLE